MSVDARDFTLKYVSWHAVCGAVVLSGIRACFAYTARPRFPRPSSVAFQNHDEDISMSWFAVCDGYHKLVQVLREKGGFSSTGNRFVTYSYFCH